jgi:hypothetical protein
MIELRLVDSECFEPSAIIINVGVAINVGLYYHHLKPQNPHIIHTIASFPSLLSPNLSK